MIEIAGSRPIYVHHEISGSSGKTGYFDITVKKQGVVSTFLNEKAREGLEVVAHGPYGRFYLDGTHHVEPVFFAGGSGITPILSMLLHLETTLPLGIPAVGFQH